MGIRGVRRHLLKNQIAAAKNLIACTQFFTPQDAFFTLLQFSIWGSDFYLCKWLNNEYKYIRVLVLT